MAIQLHLCLKHFNFLKTMNNRLLLKSLYSISRRCLRTSPELNYTQEFCKFLMLRKFGPPGNLAVDVTLRPFPSEGQILIKVEYAGINPVDTYIREGLYKKLPTLPTILGKEVSGTIERIHPSVSKRNKYKLKVGDRVFARMNDNGGYSEYVLADVSCVYPLKGNLSFAQGAAIYVAYFTAYRALVIKSGIECNETLLIHGASGGVGIAALQIARRLGVRAIVATAGTEEGMNMLKEMRSDYVFNHRKKGHVYEAKDTVAPNGFDVIFENNAHLHLGDDCNVLAPGGRIAVVGCRGAAEITPRSLMVTEGEIVGVNLGHFTQEELEECADFIIEGMEKEWLNPVVSHEYLMTEAPKAHFDMINKNTSKGKLVFKMTHEPIDWPNKYESKNFPSENYESD